MSKIKGILRRVYNKIYPEQKFPDNKRYVSCYSQNGEDLIVDAILGCKPTGIYVDIGANDPIDLSNTYRFYQRGWTGICIEPNPEKINNLHMERPRDTILNVGVSNYPATATLYVLDHDTVSTFDKKTADATNLERGTKTTHTVEIPLRRLDVILNENLKGTQIDFMSIDVEGYEMYVLMSNDWEKYRPKVIIIEINNNTQQIIDYLYAQRYVPVLRNAENGIFVNVL
jgi:FkbM family methyltransferase